MTLQHLFLGLYVLGFLVYGYWCSRNIKTLEDYALAGRNLTLPVLLGTLFASNIGGGTVVGWTGSFYALGLDWWFTGIGALLAMAAATFILAEKTRKLKQFTVPDLLKLRYDEKTRFAGSIMIIIGDIALTAVQIISISGILKAYLNIPTQTGMIIGAFAFVAIAFYGGMVGVAFTDAIQAIFIGLGLLVGALVAVQYAGGLPALIAAVPDNYLAPFTHVTPLRALGNAVSVFGTVAVWQSIIFSRTFAAKDAKTAKKGVLFLIPASAFAYLCVSLMGWSARAIFGPGVPPATIFARLVTEVLPPALAFMLLAVVVSAILTTANSVLLSIGVNVTRDIYQKTFRPNAADKTLLRINRYAVLVIGGLALLLALTLPGIISALMFTYTMYAAALLVPVYGGYLWRRATSTGAFLSCLSGSAVVLFYQYVLTPMSAEAATGIFAFLRMMPAMLPALVVSLVVFVAGSLLTKPPTSQQLVVFDV
ncbi:MAG TPA: sodium:solute symporter family protein [Magnetospirillaceae bacterium]|nr:sodium:solute symporter family protein [Magnetospirillaceae bacterium]